MSAAIWKCVHCGRVNLIELRRCLCGVGRSPHAWTPSERASMERATAEANAAFDTLLRDRPSRFLQRRKI